MKIFIDVQLVANVIVSSKVPHLLQLVREQKLIYDSLVRTTLIELYSSLPMFIVSIDKLQCNVVSHYKKL